MAALLLVGACGTAAPARSAAPAATPAAVAAAAPVPALAEPQFASPAQAAPSLVATLVSVAPQAIVADLDGLSQRLQLPMQLGQALVTSLANVEVAGASLHIQQLWERLDPQTPLAVAWVLPKEAAAKGFCAALTFQDATLARRTVDEMGSVGEQRGAVTQRRSSRGDIIWTAMKGRTVFVSGSPDALLFAGGVAEAAQVRPSRGQIVLTVMPQALAAASGKNRKEIVAQMKTLMATGVEKGRGNAAGARMAESMAEMLTETALDSSVARLLIAADGRDGVSIQGELVPTPGSELGKLVAQRLPYAFDERLPVKNDGTAILAGGDWQSLMGMANRIFEASGAAGRATAKDLAALVALTGPWSCVIDAADAGFASLCSWALKPAAKPRAALDAMVAAAKSQHAWEAELDGRKPSALKIKRSGDLVEIERKIESKQAIARSLARALSGGDVVRSVVTVKEGRLLMATGPEPRKTLARYGAGGIGAAAQLTAAVSRTAGDELMATVDVTSFARRILVQGKDLPGRDMAVMASAMPGVAEMSAPFIFTIKGGSALTGEMHVPLASLNAIANVVRGILGAATPAR